jgi:DNA-binding CsgD family transcriptional regulator
MRGIIALVISLFCSIGSYAQEVDASTYSLNEDLSILLHKTHAERVRILIPFYEWGIYHLDSTAIFSKIDSIRTLAQEHNDRELELEAELMDVHYYRYRPYFSEELVVSKLQALGAIAKEEKVVWLEIWLQSVLANYYFFELDQYEQGFECFERVAYWLEQITSEEFPLKSECHFQIGFAHYHFKDYEQALTHLAQANADYIPRPNEYYYINTLDIMGACHRQLKALDSSNYYYEQLLEYAVQTDNRIWEGISSGSLGYNHFLQEGGDAAIPMIELEVERGKEHGDWGLVARALIHLAEIQLSVKNYDAAATLVVEAKLYVNKSGNYESSGNLFPLQSKLAAYGGNHETAALYLDSAFAVRDSLLSLTSGLKIARAKQKILLEQQKLETSIVQQDQERALWRRNAIIGVLSFLILIAFLVYRQARVRVRNRAQLAAKQREADLKEMEAFKQSLRQKNELIETFRTKLEQTAQQSENAQNVSGLALDEATQKAIIDELVESTLLTDKEWREFTARFEHIHAGFFARLNERWPALTPAEIRLMALARLNLENKEMALMLGVGTDAIRQVKSRLRKKLNLDKGVVFEELASEI